ncbi:MAG: 4Fe-4S binding protein [Magnetococcus sp. THC-1_WYH]
MANVPEASTCLINGKEFMVHPGLPDLWVTGVMVVMGFFVLRALLFRFSPTPPSPGLILERLPGIGSLVRLLSRSPWPMTLIRIVVAALFLLVIAAGLWGTPLPYRNLATTLTWTLWWTWVIISVFFLGSAWCSVCPWDTLAGWLVRHRLWRRPEEEMGLGLKLPPRWRRTWPALGMFIGLTWLELGVGITLSPRWTALLALGMIVLAVIFMALFERKGFCRHVCPVGRTIGFYAQLSPVSLRPIEESRCLSCQTLECYHGSKEIEPCPTHLTMGRFSQNTYCLSCGACVLSCPHGNVSWRLRPMATEASSQARPHWDEAWFMIILLALTSFHGVTMLPAWEHGILWLAPKLGDSATLLRSFSVGLVLMILTTAGVYTVAVETSRRLMGITLGFKRWFALLSFATLPVAFAYHIAHNLGHLVRESSGSWEVWFNPMGIGTLPRSKSETSLRMFDTLLPLDLLHGLQAGVMVWGFWLGMHILQQRTWYHAQTAQGQTNMVRLSPMIVFLVLMTGCNLWLLNQEMIVRF